MTAPFKLYHVLNGVAPLAGLFTRQAAGELHLGPRHKHVAGLGEFIFAGAMAYWLLGEVPRWAFYAASALVVAGALLALCDTPEETLATEVTERPLGG